MSVCSHLVVWWNLFIVSTQYVISFWEFFLAVLIDLYSFLCVHTESHTICCRGDWGR